MGKLRDITELTLRAGAIISESAGETYRVEETMRHLSLALGADQSSPYATPTGLFLSCQLCKEAGENPGDDCKDMEIVTRMERLKTRSTNLGKISEVNALSREAVEKARENKSVDIKKFKNRLELIENESPYSTLTTILATAFSAFVFALLFSGSIKDACIAFVISFLMKATLNAIKTLKLSNFISTLIGSMIVSFSSSLLSVLGVSMSFGIVNISVLMALVPGVAIVMAIRDIIAGDYVSGRGRATEAFVIALSISLGSATGLLLFPSSIEYNTEMTLLLNPTLAFVYAGLISACFAIMFQVKKISCIVWTGLTGALSWMIFVILINNAMSDILAFMVGAFCVGLIAEILAFILKDTAPVFSIPALIAFVPGGGMYAIMFNIVLEHSEKATSAFLSTLSIAGSIALGIAFASGFARVVLSAIKKAKNNAKEKLNKKII